MWHHHGDHDETFNRLLLLLSLILNKPFDVKRHRIRIWIEFHHVKCEWNLKCAIVIRIYILHALYTLFLFFFRFMSAHRDVLIHIFTPPPAYASNLSYTFFLFSFSIRFFVCAYYFVSIFHHLSCVPTKLVRFSDVQKWEKRIKCLWWLVSEQHKL